MSNQQRKTIKGTSTSCRVKEAEIAILHSQTDSWRRWLIIIQKRTYNPFFFPSPTSTQRDCKRSEGNVLKSSWYLQHLNSCLKNTVCNQWGQSSTLKNESEEKVKKSCCILSSCSPAVWGHLRDWRRNYPAASAARKIRLDKGRGREELMKGRDSSGPPRASRHLPGELPPPNLL